MIKLKLSPKRFAVAALLLVAVASFPFLTYAQATVDPTDPTAVLGGLLVAVQAKAWLVVAGFVSMGLVWVFRTFVLKKWAWAQTDRGGVTVNLLVNLVMVLGTEAISGHATWASLLDVLLVTVLSSGFYSPLRKILWPSDLGQKSFPTTSSGAGGGQLATGSGV